MEAYQLLEREFGRWAGVENVVACSSGTAALHLALESLRLPPGSAVIMPDFTMVACARAVALAGLTPVFVDCGPDLLMDPRLLVQAVEREAAIGHPRAIMAVHVYGRAEQMGLVTDLANKYDLAVVEDLAEAHGLPPHPSTDAACWSFYRNKVIGGEEGGAVAFRDKKSKGHTEYNRALSLRSMGFGPNQDYVHTPRGHNYRLANCLAEKVLESLRTYPLTLIARRLREAELDAVCPPEWKMPPRAVPWVYDFWVAWMTLVQQDAAVRRLRELGYAARHGFKPMSEQEEFRWCRRHSVGAAEEASREVIYVGLGADVPDPSAVFEVVRTVLKS